MHGYYSLLTCVLIFHELCSGPYHIFAGHDVSYALVSEWIMTSALLEKEKKKKKKKDVPLFYLYISKGGSIRS